MQAGTFLLSCYISYPWLHLLPPASAPTTGFSSYSFLPSYFSSYSFLPSYFSSCSFLHSYSSILPCFSSFSYFFLLSYSSSYFYSGWLPLFFPSYSFPCTWELLEGGVGGLLGK